MRISKSDNICKDIINRRREDVYFELNIRYGICSVYEILQGIFHSNLTIPITQQIQYDFYGKQFDYYDLSDYALKEEYKKTLPKDENSP